MLTWDNQHVTSNKLVKECSSFTCVNFASQWLQEKGLILSWTDLMWVFRVDFLVNEFEQTAHANGFSFSCTPCKTGFKGSSAKSWISGWDSWKNTGCNCFVHQPFLIIFLPMGFWVFFYFKLRCSDWGSKYLFVLFLYLYVTSKTNLHAKRPIAKVTRICKTKQNCKSSGIWNFHTIWTKKPEKQLANVKSWL